MYDDDGLSAFGSNTDHAQAIHWDTREWREEMEARYSTDTIVETNTDD